MANVAFIGLGVMGLAMSKNIVSAGHNVTGYDVSKQAMDALVAHGGTSASSAADAATGANFVITMLPNGDVVREAIFGKDGAVQTMDSSAILIDTSTIHPLQTDAIRKDLKAAGISMVDAAVGRTSTQAVSGQCLFMVGAEGPDLEAARPILNCMGDTIVDCGGPGMGSRMKIVNNLMTTTLNVLTAEVLTFSDAVGLNRDTAIDVMRGTPAVQSHMTTTYPVRVLKGDLSAAFMIDLATKDLGIALDLSEDLDIDLSMGKSAKVVYAEAQSKDRGTQDWTAVYDMLREKYGLKTQ